MATAGQGGAASRRDRAAGQPHVAELQAVAARYITGCTAGPDGWLRLLAAVAENPGAGFTGAVLIAAQEPGPAASYEDWKAAGWQVRRGEQARVWVLAGDGGDRRPAAVFTRSQVRPARKNASPPLPGPAAASAGTPERAFGALITVARRRRYAVTRPDDVARPCTDFDQRSIAIPAALDPPAAAGALARELAYIIRDENLPRLAGEIRPPGETTATRYGAEVLEADSAGWLVLARLGLDPAAAGLAFPAAQAWAAGDPRSPLTGLITAAGERITQTATQITADAGKVLASLPPAPAAPAPAATPAPGSGSEAGAAPSYGRYPRGSQAGQAIVTDRPAWPYPDQALIQVNMAAAAFYRARLKGSWAEGYLQGRGFGPEICRRWQLGYAPRGWTTLLDHLRACKFTDQVIEQAGLATQSSRGSLIDRFRDRVIIPVRGPHGQVAGFAGRAHDGAPDGTPKYINTRTTPVYHKDELLYGLPEAAAALGVGARPVLVEGYLDVIAVTVAGADRLAGVGTGGTALSVAQVQLLAASCDLVRTPPLDARDPDGPGRRAAAHDFTILTPFSPAAGAAALPEGRDPAKIFELGGREALAAALAAGEHPLADVAVDVALDPWQEHLDNEWAVGQLNAVRAAAGLLAATPPADLARQVLRVAERTKMPHWEVAGEFAIAAAAAAAEPRPKAPRRDRDRPRHGASREFPAAPAQGRKHADRRPARTARPPGRGQRHR